VNSNVELQSKVRGVMRSNNAASALYEPLVGTKGEIYQDLGKRDSSSSLGSDRRDENSSRSHEKMMDNGTNIKDMNPPYHQKRLIHPRITCFTGFNDDPSSCHSLAMKDIHADYKKWPSSIPQQAIKSGKGGGSSSDDVTNLNESETKECKLSDPSYQALPAAPSTCNDIHALGFRFGPTEREHITGNEHRVYPSRHKMKYLTSGGFRSVWTVTQLDEEEDPRVIMKTNQLKRGWSSYYLDQNRRDVLVSERAGKSPMHSNLLPVYQYCAFSSIVPFATAGVLDDYVYDRRKKGDLLSAEEQYVLAMQAAIGLYQAHLYSGGKATHTHADVKPSQFLLFEQPRPGRKEENNNTTIRDSMPIMQINDFNRGKFLTRSIKDNETCPFQMCHVKHKGSLYRSPEEYMKCADQTDGIDVFSLGGIFYYILSDGQKPWYYIRSYDEGVKLILNGEQPRLPNVEEYKRDGERSVAQVKERSKHPAFIALKEVMSKCWAFKPKDRPSSLQVVQMLEDKWHEINPSTTRGKRW